MEAHERSARALAALTDGADQTDADAMNAAIVVQDKAKRALVLIDEKVKELEYKAALSSPMARHYNNPSRGRK